MMGWEAPPSHRLHNYKLGINEFSDMSPDEFAKTHFGYTKPETPWGNLNDLYMAKAVLSLHASVYTIGVVNFKIKTAKANKEEYELNCTTPNAIPDSPR